MPRLLELYCSAGGSAMGYYQAGFTEIVGVDILPQPRFPFEFVQGDALEFVRKHGHEFDMVVASPPCQAYNSLSKLNGKLHGKTYPDLIAATREALQATGKPYAIENVMDAKKHLINPVMLCGTFFGLKVYRHRLFECFPSLTHLQPHHLPHNDRSPGCKGDRTSPKGFITVCGGKGGGFRLEPASKAMGIDWMTRKELALAIPPAYTRWIGKHMLEVLSPNLQPTADDIGRYVYCDELEAVGLIQSVGVTRETPVHPARRTAQVLFGADTQTVLLDELELLPLDRELACLQSELTEIQQQIDSAAVTKEAFSKKSSEYKVLEKHLKSEWKRFQDCIKRAKSLADFHGKELAMPGQSANQDGWFYQFQVQEKATEPTAASHKNTQGEYTMTTTVSASFDIDAEIAKYQTDIKLLETKSNQTKMLKARVKSLKSTIQGLEQCREFSVGARVFHDYHEEGGVLTPFVDDRKVAMVKIHFDSGLEEAFPPSQLKLLPDAVTTNEAHAQISAIASSQEIPPAIESYLEKRAAVPDDKPISEAEISTPAVSDEVELEQPTVVEIVGISDDDEIERLTKEIKAIERSRQFEIGRRLLRMQEVWKESEKYSHSDFSEYVTKFLGYKQSYWYELTAAAKVADKIPEVLESSINAVKPISKMLKAKVKTTEIQALVKGVAATGRLTPERIEEAAQKKGLLPKKEPAKSVTKVNQEVKAAGQSLGLSGKESQQLPDTAPNPDIPEITPPKALHECLTQEELRVFCEQHTKAAAKEWAEMNWEQRFEVRGIWETVESWMTTCAYQQGLKGAYLLEADNKAKIEWLEGEVLRLTQENQALSQQLEAGLCSRASTRTDEWYTPPEYIEMAREVMGSIDLDPASNELAQSWIQATKYFTKDDEGLIVSDWYDWQDEPVTVWCNPPYGRMVEEWLDTAIRGYEDGDIKSAILLLNRTGASWYKSAIKGVTAICEVHKRVAFIDENGDRQPSPRYYNDFLYLGQDIEKFREVFSKIGDVRVMQVEQQQKVA